MRFEQLRSRENFECLLVNPLHAVRRIKKYKVRRDVPGFELRQRTYDLLFEHFEADLESQGAEIALDQSGSGRRGFHKIDFRRSPAQGFNAYRACACAQIQPD